MPRGMSCSCELGDNAMPINWCAAHARLYRSLVEAEREACAKVAEDFYRKSTLNSRVRSLGQDAADGIASAIRNRIS